jgi:hypothetical protein
MQPISPALSNTLFVRTWTKGVGRIIAIRDDWGGGVLSLHSKRMMQRGKGAKHIPAERGNGQGECDRMCKRSAMQRDCILIMKRRCFLGVVKGNFMPELDIVEVVRYHHT